MTVGAPRTAARAEAAPVVVVVPTPTASPAMGLAQWRRFIVFSSFQCT